MIKLKIIAIYCVDKYDGMEWSKSVEYFGMKQKKTSSVFWNGKKNDFLDWVTDKQRMVAKSKDFFNFNSLDSVYLTDGNFF